jgi:hypothetical protein
MSVYYPWIKKENAASVGDQPGGGSATEEFERFQRNGSEIRSECELVSTGHVPYLEDAKIRSKIQSKIRRRYSTVKVL